MTRRRRRLAVPALLAAGLVAAGCTTNPATGRQDFTPFMGPADEAAVGAEEHPKLLAAFGGVYDERGALTAYVNQLGRRLQLASEQRGQRFTFTIVNSDEVNAFALPGGYIYVTRGLMALANSEAELAGVIAHEIGHVTARHSAQRYNRVLFARLGTAMLGVAVGNRLISDLARFGAAAYLQGYSREQEFEADQLGIRYLRGAGYDPRAMASFLGAMQEESALAARIAGAEGRAPEASLFSSHPRTLDRVARAAEAAWGAQPALRTGRDEYLLRLDNTLFGDDPEQGIRRGREFAHPDLGFRFKVPPGFRMRNTPRAVLAANPDGAVVRFDRGDLDADTATTRYLTDIWLSGVALDRVERITINGMEAATGAGRATTPDGARDVRAVAIRYDDDTVYRFLILTPPELTQALSEGLRRMTYSFRPMTPREIRNLRPKRIRIHQVGPGDSVDSLAATLPYDDFKAERFRVLNGLGAGEALAPGRLVKLIAE
ncbi:MAG: M48 family metalloprotease [Proteobacteria bacterium]|nr:M48 family metalloprotease [Pseudomonadota bacterium]